MPSLDWIGKKAVENHHKEVPYRLRLLKDTGYLTDSEFDSIHAEADERCRIIGSIRKTAKDKPAPQLKSMPPEPAIHNS